MTPFIYQRPTSIEAALAALAATPNARLLGGGTCLIDLMKQGVEQPETIIDLNFAPDLAGLAVLPSGALRIGATTTLSHVARDPRVEHGWPLLHDIIVAGLTPQLRNAASFGGNIMQRPRCIFFLEPDFACNKKRPGSGCAARAGVHYQHAIFGGDATKACIAVHPSDLCVALTILDAMIVTASPAGGRRFPIDELHRLPGDDPSRETTLRTDEIIVAVEVPPQAANTAAYVKGTEGFTLASCAAMLMIHSGVITNAAIVLGGVAHKPWRSDAAERTLAGQPADEPSFAAAADAATGEAVTDFQTAFRVPLLKGVIVEALELALRAEGGA
ncbi:MAG: xanthine dehydrogenase family protein subunit M [Beijerinckiaceae bacterium]|nr:xanthine dehydrogenase family protein subunit M [Beijerinckiaceae bacterium]